jgi:hypothetical protein
MEMAIHMKINLKCSICQFGFIRGDFATMYLQHDVMKIIHRVCAKRLIRERVEILGDVHFKMIQGQLIYEVM